ncbi:hypothetical protein I3843_Q045200 [Carya illinoinensis]|nr:hypothetical protein I3843_Q045200 [Carya illinoinensis]
MVPLTPLSTIARAECFTHAAVKYGLIRPTKNPRVTKHDVKLPIVLDRPFYHGFDLLFISNITMDVCRMVQANGFGHLLAYFFLDISNHHHACTMLGKNMCGRLPDATSTACDYGHFAF